MNIVLLVLATLAIAGLYSSIRMIEKEEDKWMIAILGAMCLIQLYGFFFWLGWLILGDRLFADPVAFIVLATLAAVTPFINIMKQADDRDRAARQQEKQ